MDATIVALNAEAEALVLEADRIEESRLRKQKNTGVADIPMMMLEAIFRGFANAKFVAATKLAEDSI